MEDCQKERLARAEQLLSSRERDLPKLADGEREKALQIMTILSGNSSIIGAKLILSYCERMLDSSITQFPFCDKAAAGTSQGEAIGKTLISEITGALQNS